MTDKKDNGGRPTKYKAEYCQDLLDYFMDETIKPLPLFERFAMKLDISRSTLYKWGNEHKEFSDTLKRAKEIQEALWIERVLESKLNVPFAIFMGKNCFGWTDKTEQTHKVDSVDDIIKAISGD